MAQQKIPAIRTASRSASNAPDPPSGDRPKIVSMKSTIALPYDKAFLYDYYYEYRMSIFYHTEMPSFLRSRTKKHDTIRCSGQREERNVHVTPRLSGPAGAR
jgi:hypothetical protein